MRAIKKAVIILIILALLAGILSAFTVLILSHTIVSATRDRVYTAETIPDGEYDCILVLGAGVKKDGNPSDMLRDRLDTALMVYDKGLSDILLMSGDHTRVGYDEVNCMKDYALDKGAEYENVLVDPMGVKTYDSVYRLKEHTEYRKIVIISQGYHLYRALYIADKMGLDAVGVSADLHTYIIQPIQDVREALARVKAFLYVHIDALPEYMENTISADGKAYNPG